MKKSEKMKGLLAVKIAAHVAEVDRFTIYRWLWSGKLKGLRRGRRWVIPAHELMKLKKGGG